MGMCIRASKFGSCLYSIVMLFATIFFFVSITKTDCCGNLNVGEGTEVTKREGRGNTEGRE